MGTRFNHFSLIQDNDSVKFKETENSVRNYKGGFILKISVQPGDYLLFCPGVHRTQAIIKNYDFMIAGQCPRNRNSLLLPAA